MSDSRNTESLQNPDSNAEHQPDSGVGIINGHEYVDLGLPSSIKWATCNLGASQPEEYGSFFAWGETKPKEIFIYENSIVYCRLYDIGDTLLGSDYIDVNGNLRPPYDAARKNWGASWRMPTEEEFKELLDNTTQKVALVNRAKGFWFTSKTNGNRIFIPTAGYKFAENHCHKRSAFYWSSSYSHSWCAKNLWIDKTYFLCSNTQIVAGFTIRPVSD